jgi:hypothetical protein
MPDYDHVAQVERLSRPLDVSRRSLDRDPIGPERRIRDAEVSQVDEGHPQVLAQLRREDARVQVGVPDDETGLTATLDPIAKGGPVHLDDACVFVRPTLSGHECLRDSMRKQSTRRCWRPARGLRARP